MKYFIKNFIFIFSCLFAQVLNASNFRSNMFSFEDPLEARGLHVSLKHDNITILDVRPADIDFHTRLFADQKAMKLYCEGKPRSCESVDC